MIHKIHEICVCGTQFDDGMHRLCNDCRVNPNTINYYNKYICDNHTDTELGPVYITVYEPHTTDWSMSDLTSIKQGTSDVIMENIITFTRGGESVGSLNAKFDFSTLHPEFHQKAINIIQGMSINLCLMIDDVNKPSEVIVQEGSVSVWSRFKNKLGLK